MCGRYALTLPPDAVRRWFGVEEAVAYPPRYNIAPTQPILVVRSERRDGTVARQFALMRWAFMPAFAKDPAAFPLVFNARSEGIADKASFRNAVRRRRCLVPADAFYEWQRAVSAKAAGKVAGSQPYLMRRRDGAPLGLAAIWETWNGPNGEAVDTACIVTTQANAATRTIHPRLPAIVAPDDFALWLDPDERATAAALALLRPAADDILEAIAIGSAINNVRHDGPEVRQPAPSETPRATELPAQPSLF